MEDKIILAFNIFVFKNVFGNCTWVWNGFELHSCWPSLWVNNGGIEYFGAPSLSDFRLLSVLDAKLILLVSSSRFLENINIRRIVIARSGLSEQAVSRHMRRKIEHLFALSRVYIFSLHLLGLRVHLALHSAESTYVISLVTNLFNAFHWVCIWTTKSAWWRIIDCRLDVGCQAERVLTLNYDICIYRAFDIVVGV